jgi:hypothetical protein
MTARMYKKILRIEKCGAPHCPFYIIDMSQRLCSRSSEEVTLEQDTGLYKVGDPDSHRVYQKGETVSLMRKMDSDDWDRIRANEFPEWCPLERWEDE